MALYYLEKTCFLGNIILYIYIRECVGPCYYFIQYIFAQT